MDKSRTIIRNELFKVIRNQIKENEPPETKQTNERLLEMGYPENEIIRMLASALSQEMFNMLKSNRTFNHKSLVKLLEELPDYEL